ncbi:MAG: hypothetical protein P8Y45_14990 [Exilibacterium sp.]
MLYEKIDVFERGDNCLKIYRCFKNLSNNLYYVQSLDHVYEPVDADQIISSEKQLYELLIDDELLDRTDGFATLEKAILVFKDEFKS